ncbi:MAG: flagellin FliC, partial [Acidimicrobiales bacterium]
MRDLSVQAANDTNDTDARNAIDSEMDALVAEIGRIGTDTTFSGATVFSATGVNFQVGSEGTGTNGQISVTTGALTTAGLGINALAVNDATAARASIESVDTAINSVSTMRGNLGATQNR